MKLLLVFSGVCCASLREGADESWKTALVQSKSTAQSPATTARKVQRWVSATRDRILQHPVTKKLQKLKKPILAAGLVAGAVLGTMALAPEVKGGKPGSGEKKPRDLPSGRVVREAESRSDNSARQSHEMLIDRSYQANQMIVDSKGGGAQQMKDSVCRRWLRSDVVIEFRDEIEEAWRPALEKLGASLGLWESGSLIDTVRVSFGPLIQMVEELRLRVAAMREAALKGTETETETKALENNLKVMDMDLIRSSGGEGDGWFVYEEDVLMMLGVSLLLPETAGYQQGLDRAARTLAERCNDVRREDRVLLFLYFVRRVIPELLDLKAENVEAYRTLTTKFLAQQTRGLDAFSAVGFLFLDDLGDGFKQVALNDMFFWTPLSLFSKYVKNREVLFKMIDHVIDFTLTSGDPITALMTVAYAGYLAAAREAPLQLEGGLLTLVGAVQEGIPILAYNATASKLFAPLRIVAFNRHAKGLIDGLYARFPSDAVAAVRSRIDRDVTDAAVFEYRVVTGNGFLEALERFARKFEKAHVGKKVPGFRRKLAKLQSTDTLELRQEFSEAAQALVRRNCYGPEGLPQEQKSYTSWASRFEVEARCDGFGIGFRTPAAYKEAYMSVGPRWLGVSIRNDYI